MRTRLTTREHVLLVAAMLAAALMGYWLFRYRPAVATIRELSQKAQQAREQVQQVQWPAAPTTEPAQLQSQLARAEEKLADARTRLALLERQFAPADGGEAIQHLKVELFDLASRSGLRIAEDVPFNGNLASTSRGARDAQPAKPGVGTIASKDHAADPSARGAPDYTILMQYYRRPIEKLTIEGPYGGLRRFLKGLEHLPWRVVVLDFGIAATQANSNATAQRDVPPHLTATLVLAL